MSVSAVHLVPPPWAWLVSYHPTNVRSGCTESSSAPTGSPYASHLVAGDEPCPPTNVMLYSASLH